MGTSFGANQTFKTPEGSLNGDRYADLVTFDENEYAVAISNGAYLSSSNSWSIWGCSPHSRIADFDGDGKDDLIGPGAKNTWAVGLSSGSGFNKPGTQAWLWGIRNQPSWHGVG